MLANGSPEPYVSSHIITPRRSWNNTRIPNIISPKRYHNRDTALISNIGNRYCTRIQGRQVPGPKFHQSKVKIISNMHLYNQSFKLPLVGFSSIRFRDKKSSLFILLKEEFHGILKLAHAYTSKALALL